MNTMPEVGDVWVVQYSFGVAKAAGAERFLNLWNAEKFASEMREHGAKCRIRQYTTSAKTISDEITPARKTKAVQSGIDSSDGK